MRSEATGLTDTAFEELRSRGLKAIETGKLEEAAESFAAALRLAGEQGDPKRIDLALCNWAAAVIELGRGDGEISRLREVLLRNGDPVSCRMAAYDIARYYELKKNYKKALFYARITQWVASTRDDLRERAAHYTCRHHAHEEPACPMLPALPSMWWCCHCGTT